MKINKIFVALFVMLSLVLSVSATVEYDSTLVLENKDPTTWVAIDDSLGGTLEYNSAGQEFEYSFTGTVSQAETTYALVYYIDVGPTDPETGKPWNLANSEKIATGTSDSGGDLVISGSNNLGDLPQSGDYNANPNEVDSYCDYENGFDDYLHCSGAKIWVMPETDFDTVAWNPTAWLFETDLITYVEDDEGPEITNVHSVPEGYLTCDQSNVHIYATIIDELSEVDTDSVKVSWKYDGSSSYSSPLFLHDSVEDIWRGVIDLNSNGAYDGLVISYHVGAKDIFGNSKWEPAGFTGTYTYDCADPTAEAGGDEGGNYYCDEGTEVQLDASGSSDTVDEELDYAWDLDNDGEFDDSTEEKPMFTCVDDSVNPVAVKVTDTVGNTDTDSATVTVENLNPTADAGGDGEGEYHCDEGETISLDASGSSDPAGVNDPLTYAWDLNGVDENEDGDFYDDAFVSNPNFVCGNGDATIPVAVKVIDDDEGSDVDGATVVVISNVAPEVEAGEDVESNEGDEITINPTFTDFNADTHTATIDWGDGNVEDLGTVTSPLSVSHTYCDDGIYQVTLTVNDGEDDGSDTLTVDVSNVDPTITDLGLGTDEEGYVGVKGEEICFDATAEDPGDDHPLIYEWDFGEGYDTENCHTWDERFDETVGLRVTDGDGGSAETTVAVKIYDYKIDLGSNRNLISLPLVPEDTSIVEVLNGVVPEAVWAYQYNEETGKNEWLFHPPEAPEGVGSLEKMIPGYGYYVFMGDEGDTLYANGNKYYGVEEDLQIPMPPQVTLTTGWNLIGHYGMNDVDKWWEVQDLSGGSLTDLAILTLLDENAVPVTELLPRVGYWTFVTSQENLFYAPSVADYCDEEQEECDFPYWYD